MGIEPIAPGVSPEPDGFEGRAGHQTRIASLATTIIVPGRRLRRSGAGFVPSTTRRIPYGHLPHLVRRQTSEHIEDKAMTSARRTMVHLLESMTMAFAAASLPDGGHAREPTIARRAEA